MAACVERYAITVAIGFMSMLYFVASFDRPMRSCKRNARA
jgi:hypothetical protein